MNAATPTLRILRRAANFHRIHTDDFKAVLAAARVECDQDPTLDYERQALRLIHAASERNDVRAISLDIGDGEDDGHACDKIGYESWQQTQSSDEPTLDDLLERARIASLDARIPTRVRNFLARLAAGGINTDHDTSRWLPRLAQMRAEGML